MEPELVTVDINIFLVAIQISCLLFIEMDNCKNGFIDSIILMHFRAFLFVIQKLGNSKE